MYSINREDESVIVRDHEQQVVYRAKENDFIIIEGHGVVEVGKVPDKTLIEALHEKGILR